MTVRNENLECVICNESLCDPRALPCGHSFCGPPRPCLSSLACPEGGGGGGLKCAICRKSHNLKPLDIRPLYGIRDYIQGSNCKKRKLSPSLPCEAHPDNECTMWCNDCLSMICDLCFEDEHDGHSMRKLKKYLTQEVETLFGKPFNDAILKYRDTVKKVIEARTSKLELMKSEIITAETEVTSAQQQKTIIDKYLKVINNETPPEELSEMSLLLKLSKIDRLSLEKGSQSPKKILDSPKRSSKSSPMFEPEIELNGTVKEIIKSPKSECVCYFKHSTDVSLRSPFTFMGALRVLERNPLRLGYSDMFVLCPFQFWIESSLVSSQVQQNRREKVLNIFVNCRHRDGKTLPPVLNWAIRVGIPLASFKYKLVLVNWEDKEPSKSKEGTWTYPDNEKLFWQAGAFSEIFDPKKKWVIDDENKGKCIWVVLDLKQIT